MLCNNQVNMSWICQELAQGVHNKENIWSRIRHVHQALEEISTQNGPFKEN